MTEIEAMKALFVDSESNEHYVALQKSRNAYSKLVNSLKNPFKIILLHGRPGSGKSFLLQMFYDNHKEKLNIFFFKEPLFDNVRSLATIYNKVSGENTPADMPLDARLELFREKIHDDIYILLDEAQLYDDTALEWIRILSNQPVFKFVISVHKIDKEDILAKEHFKTRAFETIELPGLNQKEVELYIEKKLLMASDLEFATLFSKSNYRLIHRLTKGNLRDINRLMSRTLDILEHRMEKARTFFGSNLNNKFIEMAALDLKMNHG